LIAVLKQPNVAVNGVQSDAFTIMPEHGPQIRFEDSGLRGRAINSLGQIKDPRAVDSLVAALMDQNANVRENAGGALGEIKDPRAVEPLIAAIKDTKTGCAAVAALGKIKDTRAINPLMAALKEKETGYCAAYALNQFGAPGIDILLAAMKDAKSDTRQAAASALVEINDPRVTNALLDALKEHDIPVIASTYFFFIHHGEPGSQDALIQALDTYGNKSMAETYLNCGNGKLEQAGANWATRNGYKTTANSIGGASTRWGSAR